MHSQIRRLFFTCPTDFMEVKVNEHFTGENFFLTSLGNAMIFDSDTVIQVNELLVRKGISEIYFVLNHNNGVLSDVLNNKGYAYSIGMGELYEGSGIQLQGLWNTADSRSFFLSRHLNRQINELRKGLSCLSDKQWDIEGFIYDRDNHQFQEIYSEWMYFASARIN